MNKPRRSVPFLKIRSWRYLVILLILGIAVHFFLPQLTSFENYLTLFRKMTWWAVLLSVISQAMSYLGSGYILHSILASNQQKLSVFRGVLIALASASIGLVAGGWVGAAAATYGWIHRENQNDSLATLAGTLPAMLNNMILTVVAALGVVYLLLIHDLTQVQLMGFGIVLFVICLIILGCISALRYPEKLIRIALIVSRYWAKLSRKSYRPQGLVAGIRQFVLAWHSLGNGNWKKPLFGAAVNIGFDILTLFFMFIAVGYPVNLGVLFAGYGLPFILGKLAFMFPGGVGVMEGGMVAMYKNLQVPTHIGVVVILGYRLLSFWIPSLLGFISIFYLDRSASKRGLLNGS